MYIHVHLHKHTYVRIVLSNALLWTQIFHAFLYFYIVHCDNGAARYHKLTHFLANCAPSDLVTTPLIMAMYLAVLLPRNHSPSHMSHVISYEII
jgi:hypothetical protein